MSAVILRAVTSKVQPCSARIPPNDLSTARTWSERPVPSAIGVTPASSWLDIVSHACRLARGHYHSLQSRRWPPVDQLLRGDEQAVGHESRDQHENHAQQRPVDLAGDR